MCFWILSKFLIFCSDLVSPSVSNRVCKLLHFDWLYWWAASGPAGTLNATWRTEKSFFSFFLSLPLSFSLLSLGAFTLMVFQWVSHRRERIKMPLWHSSALFCADLQTETGDVVSGLQWRLYFHTHCKSTEKEQQSDTYCSILWIFFLFPSFYLMSCLLLKASIKRSNTAPSHGRTHQLGMTALATPQGHTLLI